MKSFWGKSVAVILCATLALLPAFAAAGPAATAPAKKVTEGAESANPAGVPLQKVLNTSNAQTNGLGTFGWGLLGTGVLGGLGFLGVLGSEVLDHESTTGGSSTSSSSHH